MGLITEDRTDRQAVEHWFEERMCPTMLSLLSFLLEHSGPLKTACRECAAKMDPASVAHLCDHERCWITLGLLLAQLANSIQPISPDSADAAWDYAHAAALRLRVALNPTLKNDYWGVPLSEDEATSLGLRGYAEYVVSNVGAALDTAYDLVPKRGRPPKH